MRNANVYLGNVKFFGYKRLQSIQKRFQTFWRRMVPRQQSGNKAVKAARATRPLGQQGRAARLARVTETITFYFQTKKNFRLDSSQIYYFFKSVKLPEQQHIYL